MPLPFGVKLTNEEIMNLSDAQGEALVRKLNEQRAGDYDAGEFAGEIDTDQGRLQNFGSQVVRGATGVLGGAVRGLGETATALTGGELKDSALYGIGQDIVDLGNQADINPEYSDEFWASTLPSAIGSTAAFGASMAIPGGIAAKVAGKGAGLLAKGATAGKAAGYTTGGAMGWQNAMDQVIQDYRIETGRDPTAEEMEKIIIPSAIGIAEVYVPGRILGKLGGAKFSEVAKGLKGHPLKTAYAIGRSTIPEALTEGAQEASTAYLTNYAAKEILEYDTDRAMSEDMLHSALGGAGAGALLSAVGGGIGMRAAKKGLIAAEKIEEGRLKEKLKIEKQKGEDIAKGIVDSTTQGAGPGGGTGGASYASTEGIKPGRQTIKGPSTNEVGSGQDMNVSFPVEDILNHQPTEGQKARFDNKMDEVEAVPEVLRTELETNARDELGSLYDLDTIDTVEEAPGPNMFDPTVMDDVTPVEETVEEETQAPTTQATPAGKKAVKKKAVKKKAVKKQAMNRESAARKRLKVAIEKLVEKGGDGKAVTKAIEDLAAARGVEPDEIRTKAAEYYRSLTTPDTTDDAAVQAARVEQGKPPVEEEPKEETILSISGLVKDHKRDELVTMAGERGIEVKKSWNKGQIAKRIFDSYRAPTSEAPIEATEPKSDVPVGDLKVKIRKLIDAYNNSPTDAAQKAVIKRVRELANAEGKSKKQKNFFFNKYKKFAYKEMGIAEPVGVDRVVQSKMEKLWDALAKRSRLVTEATDEAEAKSAIKEYMRILRAIHDAHLDQGVTEPMDSIVQKAQHDGVWPDAMDAQRASVFFGQQDALGAQYNNTYHKQIDKAAPILNKSRTQGVIKILPEDVDGMREAMRTIDNPVTAQKRGTKWVDAKDGMPGHWEVLIRNQKAWEKAKGEAFDPLFAITKKQEKEGAGAPLPMEPGESQGVPEMHPDTQAEMMAMFNQEAPTEAAPEPTAPVEEPAPTAPENIAIPTSDELKFASPSAKQAYIEMLRSNFDNLTRTVILEVEPSSKRGYTKKDVELMRDKAKWRKESEQFVEAMGGPPDATFNQEGAAPQQEESPTPVEEELEAVENASVEEEAKKKYTDDTIDEIMEEVGESSGWDPEYFGAAPTDTTTARSLEEVRENFIDAVDGDLITQLESSGLVKFVRSGLDTFLEREVDNPAVFDPNTGITYFIAPNVEPGTERGLIFHEIGEHFGMEQVFSKKGYANLLNEFRELAKVDYEAQDALERARVINEGKPERHQVREGLAYYIQDNADLDVSIVRKILAAIKKFFLDKFNINLQIGRDDLIAFTHSALKATSEYTPKVNQEALFAKEKIKHWLDYDEMGRVLGPMLPKKAFKNQYIDIINNAVKKGKLKKEAVYWSGVIENLEARPELEHITREDVIKSIVLPDVQLSTQEEPQWGSHSPTSNPEGHRYSVQRIFWDRPEISNRLHKKPKESGIERQRFIDYVNEALAKKPELRERMLDVLEMKARPSIHIHYWAELKDSKPKDRWRPWSKPYSWQRAHWQRRTSKLMPYTTMYRKGHWKDGEGGKPGYYEYIYFIVHDKPGSMEKVSSAWYKNQGDAWDSFVSEFETTSEFRYDDNNRVQLSTKNPEAFRGVVPLDNVRERITENDIEAFKKILAKEMQTESRNAPKSNLINYRYGRTHIGHWRDVPDVLVHYRSVDMSDTAGDEGLFMFEIQSDWHQAATKKVWRGKEDEFGRPVHEPTGYGRPDGKDKPPKSPLILLEESLQSRREALIRRQQRMVGDISFELMPHRMARADKRVEEAPWRNSADWSTLALKVGILDAINNDLDYIYIPEGKLTDNMWNNAIADTISAVGIVPIIGKPGLYNVMVLTKETTDDRGWPVAPMWKQINNAQGHDATFSRDDIAAHIGTTYTDKLFEAEPSPKWLKDMAKRSDVIIHNELFNRTQQRVEMEDKVGELPAPFHVNEMNEVRWTPVEAEVQASGNSMAYFYDKIVMKAASKYAKKLGMNVSKSSVKSDMNSPLRGRTYEVLKLEITPKTKAIAQEGRQPMFAPGKTDNDKVVDLATRKAEREYADKMEQVILNFNVSERDLVRLTMGENEQQARKVARDLVVMSQDLGVGIETEVTEDEIVGYTVDIIHERRIPNVTDLETVRRAFDNARRAYGSALMQGQGPITLAQDRANQTNEWQIIITPSPGVDVTDESPGFRGHGRNTGVIQTGRMSPQEANDVYQTLTVELEDQYVITIEPATEVVLESDTEPLTATSRVKNNKINKLLGRIRKNLGAGAPEIIVVNGWYDEKLPQWAVDRRGALSQVEREQKRGWMKGNQIVMFAQNMENDAEFKRILLHEVFGHYAVENWVDQGKLNVFLDNLMKQPKYRALINERVYNTDPRMAKYTDTVDGRRLAMKELVAEAAETESDPSLWGRFKAWLTHILRKMSLVEGATNEEITDLLRKSASSLRNNGAQKLTSSEEIYEAVKHYAPTIKDKNEVAKVMKHVANTDTAFIEGIQSKWAAKGAEIWDYLKKTRLSQYYSALGGLSNIESYLTGRQSGLGVSSQYDEYASQLFETFENLDETQKKALSEYMSNKYAKAEDLPMEPHLQENARRAKQTIRDIGKGLVDRNLLNKDVFEANEYKYIRNQYLRYMMDIGGAQSKLGAGANMSLMEYLKHKNPHLKEEDIKKLGRVDDPAVLIASTISTIGRDIALYDMYNGIAEMSKDQKGGAWIHPGSNVKSGIIRSEEVGRKIVKRETTVAEEMYNNLLMASSSNPNYTPEDAAKENAKLAAKLEGNGYDADISNYIQIGDVKRNGKLAGQWIRKEIYNDMKAVSFIHEPVNPGGFEKVYKRAAKFNRFWKGTKTVWNPPTHVRNWVGNFVNLDMSTSTPTAVLFTKLAKQGLALADAITNDKTYLEIGGAGSHTRRAWRMADEQGITETTYSSQEVKRNLRKWQRKMKGSLVDNTYEGFLDHMPESQQKKWLKKHMPMDKIMDLAETMEDYYQGAETLFKVTKIVDTLDRYDADAKKNGRPLFNELPAEEQRALESVIAHDAQKWIFDYSLVPRGVRHLRNAPIGAPFISFAYLAFPRMFEASIKHPVKMAKYASFPFVIGSALSMMGGLEGDDEEWDSWAKTKQSLPAYMKDKFFILPMPSWDADDGKQTVVDAGYWIPFAPYIELMRDYTRMATGDERQLDFIKPIRNMGFLSGPGPDLINAALSGVDPFTGKPIVDDYGTRSEQMGDVFSYAWRMAAPTFLTDIGVAGKLRSVYTGEGNYNPRTGEQKMGYGQATLRAIGVTANTIDLGDSRAQNIRFYKSQVSKAKAKMQREIKTARLEGKSDKDLASIRKTYNDSLKHYRDKLRSYVEESD